MSGVKRRTQYRLKNTNPSCTPEHLPIRYMQCMSSLDHQQWVRKRNGCYHQRWLLFGRNDVQELISSFVSSILRIFREKLQCRVNRALPFSIKHTIGLKSTWKLRIYKLNGATSFSQSVISSNRRFAETSCRRMSIGRIVILPNSKIAETI